MNVLAKIVSFLAVFCVCDASYGAMRAGGANRTGTSTGRVSITGAVASAAMRRVPTMSVNATAAATAAASGSLMDSAECIDAYSECIKDTDVCGSDFEECTSNELFYAKKPHCNSVLLQCSSAGIYNLFGASNISDLSGDNVDVYPTPGSILGQYIKAGEISNRLDTSACVKKYTSCLNKDNVCGADFELCTDDKEFKKQKIYCEPTLARCQDEGKEELFGTTDTTKIADGSRIKNMILAGADLAGANAVSTCYKVADQCILKACTANPFRCIADTVARLADVADWVNDGKKNDSNQSNASQLISKKEITTYMEKSCYDAIAGNRFCHITSGSETPTAKDLRDQEIGMDVFSDIYTKRKDMLSQKLIDLRDKFDRKAKDACRETIASCAMRTCGEGVGSVCYASAFNKTTDKAKDNVNSVSNSITRPSIAAGCSVIVNNDVNCQYAAAATGDNLYDYDYTYQYTDDTAFDKLFPAWNSASDKSDPISAIANLNQSLAENYSDAAIAQLAKRCKTTTSSCIRSMCGTDFANCYRNRTDIMSDAYGVGNVTNETGITVQNSKWNTNFNNSMNKVSGILDFTIIRGLCISVVKESSDCEEHLKIQSYKDANNENNNGWGKIGKNTTVGGTWGATAKGYSAREITNSNEKVETGLCVAKVGGTCKSDEANKAYECGTYQNGCTYNEPQLVNKKDYQLSLSTDTLFQEVLDDLEKEAQAKYNAKLTAEQNMCVNANAGGIMGRNDMTSTYMWVKLNKKKVPTNYSAAGLTTKDFTASNDLYGSFCRARITLQSDDADIQAAIRDGADWATAYFAVGDVFTCGSWIPQSKLEAIAQKVATKKLEAQGKGDIKDGKLTTSQKWWLAGSTVLGMGVGGAGADLLQTKTGLGGLLNTTNTSNGSVQSVKDKATNCRDNAKSAYNDGIRTAEQQASYLRAAISAAKGVQNYSDSIETAIDDASKEVTKSTLDHDGLDTQAKRLYAECDIIAKMDDNQIKEKLKSNGGKWSNGTGRLVVDAGMAAITGIGTNLVVREAMKDANKAEYTQAEREAMQEFMSNVGSHIFCFIGAEEAGTFGDLVEISLE